jgi:periplasmic copper chaperone A
MTNDGLKRLLAVLLASGALMFSGRALAHIEVDSGVAVSNATNEVVFSVGHGCSGNDTFKVVIDIPAGVTSVRPMRSDFAMPTVQKDGSGNVTNVTWQKPVSDALDTDILFYRLTLRFKTPDQPLSTLYFVAHQTCRAANGDLSVVDWSDLPTTPQNQQTGNPAAALKLVPARMPGWNKFTVPAAMTDLSVFFKDAVIVWKGTASAYSANPNVASQITSTSGVTALTSLNAGDEVWVKY